MVSEASSWGMNNRHSYLEAALFKAKIASSPVPQLRDGIILDLATVSTFMAVNPAIESLK